MKYCHNCGQFLAEDTVFCPFCGMKAGDFSGFEPVETIEQTEPNQEEWQTKDEAKATQSMRDDLPNQKNSHDGMNRIIDGFLLFVRKNKLVLLVYILWFSVNLVFLSLGSPYTASEYYIFAQKCVFFTFGLFTDTTSAGLHYDLDEDEAVWFWCYDYSEFFTYVLVLPLVSYMIFLGVKAYRQKRTEG